MCHVFLPLDVLASRGGDLWLIIRDQKTTSSLGPIETVVRGELGRLSGLWLKLSEPLALEAGHQFVFLQEKSHQPFKQQSMSRYIQMSFQSVTGQKIGFQIARRIFAKGVRSLTL